jgi:hypothetical protein
MKTAIKILIGILVVLAIVLVVAELAMDKMLLKGFNTAAPQMLGVPATLDDASLSLLRGTAGLAGLHIGNPEGFKTDGIFDLASIDIELDNASLLSDTIVIKSITIDGLVLTYEQGLRKSNLGALIDQLSGDEDAKDTDATPKDKPEKKEKAADDKPGKKVIIEKLTITGSQMNVSLTGAAALTGGRVIPIPLPPITLTDLGKEKDGVTGVEAIQNVLKAILGSAGGALSGAGNLLGDGAKALGDGAWAAGQGAVDAGKAAVGGAADAGKAAVGGAADAGKAAVGGAADAGKAVVGGVGDALKSVNPFKK